MVCDGKDKDEKWKKIIACYLPNLAFCFRLTYQPLSCMLGCILVFNSKYINNVNYMEDNVIYIECMTTTGILDCGLIIFIINRNVMLICFFSQIGIKTNSEISTHC